jgi:TolB-like protein/DNA-binding SARP family transcriptional activator/Tfp pilus assembly protein PilF
MGESRNADGLHILTLGGLRIFRGPEELTALPAQPVRCALLLYIAMERSVTRDTLTATFWPERDAERARHSLSQTIYELKRSAGEPLLSSRGEQVECDSSVTVDALWFIDAVESGRDDEALEAYGGGFLRGVHLGVTPEVEKWVDRWRFALERHHRELSRRALAARVAASDLPGALDVATRWVEADPLEDEARHALIDLLARGGRRSEALRQYDTYEALLARELEVEPLDETKELVTRIREGSHRRPERAAVEMAGEAHGRATGLSAGSEPDRAAGSVPGQDARHVRENVPTYDIDAGAASASRSQRGGRPRRRNLTLAAAMVIAAIALFWTGARGTSPAGADASFDANAVAVIPFTSMSADPAQDYFADGVTEDILTSLSRIEELRVISRTSVMRFKGTELPIRDIARELGVRYLLEGSVRREGDRIRITAQLIDASTDSQIWAESFDREARGIFEIQSEIAQRVATALRHQLSPADRARISHGGTSNLVAYDLLLRGREYLNRPGDADSRKYEPALAFFRRAAEADPSWARPLAAISEAYRRNVYLPPPVAAESAVHYARRALAVDSQLAEVSAALGAAYLMAGRRELAAAELRRTLTLDRNQSEAMSELARLAALDGRLDEAVRWQRRAVSVDPTSASRHLRLGEYLFDIGDVAGAERSFTRAAEFAPDFPEASFLLAQIALIKGDSARGDALMNRLVTAASDHPATQLLLARYLTQRGRHPEAAQAFDRGPLLGARRVYRSYLVKRTEGPAAAAELLRDAVDRMRVQMKAGVPVPPRAALYGMAIVGDRDGALEVMHTHWRTGLRNALPDPPEIGIYWISAEPMMDELRGDPRFEALLQRMRAGLDSMRAIVEKGGS